MVSYDFTGRAAVVTGASAGMGAATARAFAEAGAAVAIVDINQDAAQGLADELTARGHRVLALGCDVSDEQQVAAAVARTVAAFGRLDMAFNNAGVMPPPTDAADEAAEQFDAVTAVNQRGVWASMKHELVQMRAQGSGTIVNCSSLGGLVGGCRTCRLSRIQARGARDDEERRPPICTPWSACERGMSRHHRHTHG